MFLDGIKHEALKKAFLKTMDNKPGNDVRANMEIANLSLTMTDQQINAAYADAHRHATKKNSKKNGLFDRKDPYKNINSPASKQAHAGALRANDWMNTFPWVPYPMWPMLHGCGCCCW